MCPSIQERETEATIDITCPVDDHRMDPNKPNAEVSIKVQSGAVIETQYLALLDEYNQTVTTNKGSYLEVEFSDPETIINDVAGRRVRFFSEFGVFEVSGVKIFTVPGRTDLRMRFFASRGAITDQEQKDGVFRMEYKAVIEEC